MTGTWLVRGFLLLQIAIFLAAVSIHFGLSMGGYRHQAAGTAESVIAIVLSGGLLLTWTPAPEVVPRIVEFGAVQPYVG